MEDQNPLKTQKLTKTQETINKPIKDTQKQKSPKNPRGSPVWSPILL
jgi:hypothetical protein